MFPIQKKLMLAGSSASIVALVASALPLQSAYASSITVKETHYNSSFDAVVDRQMGLSARPQTDKNGRWENASRSDVAYYMNANNFKQGTSSYLQFLNLSSSAGLSAGTINSQLLSDKGILQGQGQAFINASKLYGVNEIYLISHALLETGNGKSQLATGVQVNGKTVYNMYGIGAYDGNAVSAGAQYAYNQGWFTPEDAIIGGARFVSSNYFARGQNTLYKMRWNPANPGTYQYATDVGWAVKQTHHMSNLYSLVDDYEMTFDVPVYKNQPTGDAGNDKLEQLPTGTFGTTTARLNVRTGPGTSHSIVTTLDKDTKVELLAKQGNWYQIAVDNTTGFVSGDYLKLDKPSEDNVEDSDQELISYGETTARLNLRSQPNTSSNVLTTLALGQKLEILKKEGNWYRVRAGHQSGWVSADYVKISSNGVDKESPSLGSATTTARLNLRSGAGTNHSIITTLTKGQKVELLKKQGGWYQVKAGNRTGWVSADYLNVNGSGNVDNAPSSGSATTTARLNLRSGAGTNHSIITTLAKGQKVELLKKQGGWYQVKAGNRTGWVSADYLNVSNNQAKTESVETVIDRGTTTARLNLRVDPNTSSKIITTLNNGQQLDILKKQGSWYYVKVGSQTGWVSSQYVKLTEAKPTVQVMARTFSFAPIAPEVETNEEANESVNEENDVADLENSPSEKQQPIDEVEKEEDKQDVSPDKERDTDEHAEEPSIDENDTVPHSDEANDQTVEEDDHVADENEQASETTDTENDAENEESNLPASEEAPSEENDSTDESSLEEPQEPETDPSTDEQEPETDASADEQEPETDANTDEQEPETDASADEQDLAEQVAEEEHGDADGTSEDQESPVSDTAENNEADENSEPVQEEETDVADDEAEALPEEAEGPSEQDEEPSEATEEQQTTVGQKIQLTENTLLFSEASSDSEQLLELFEDDTIEILEEGTDFVKVKANGVEGWIAVEALAAVLP
ncbi:SH3 domain-containing protein [Shouchella rhizosphaerae]|nr:SH3 domain-containing protein [Shouchella rhizosphaerae]MDP0464994.1 SH3 domain-containing protein [Shouchella rhizosphaerae]